MLALKILLLLILIIASMMIITRISNYIIDIKYKKAILTILKNHNIATPRIKTPGRYGYPAITVIFHNKEDWEYAGKNEIFESFKNETKSIHKRIKDFDPDLAVDFTYENIDG